MPIQKNENLAAEENFPSGKKAISTLAETVQAEKKHKKRKKNQNIRVSHPHQHMATKPIKYRQKSFGQNIYSKKKYEIKASKITNSNSKSKHYKQLQYKFRSAKKFYKVASKQIKHKLGIFFKRNISCMKKTGPVRFETKPIPLPSQAYSLTPDQVSRGQMKFELHYELNLEFPFLTLLIL